MILICYAIDSPESLKNVTEVWVQEIRHYCPNCPILLIGNKSDSEDRKITTEQGQALAKELGVMFMETSAK